MNSVMQGGLQKRKGIVINFVSTLLVAIEVGCCAKKCLEEMDLAEMCMLRKSFQDYNSMQKKQTLLDWLWMHAKPNERYVH